MARPSSAASRVGLQMQGFQPTVCGPPGEPDNGSLEVGNTVQMRPLSWRGSQPTLSVVAT
jgi:hypothetical protein